MEENGMIIANNATYKSFVTHYGMQNNKLQSSMSRLSSGQRINAPGEAPADLGISQRFRAQIRNSEEAGRVIQNAVNMFQTTDSYLQEVHNILNRMSELAIASSDGSKSQEDRKNLDLEFQQLKSEVGRIAEDGKYNGLQINGRTAVATYDHHNHKIVYSQGDGTGEKALDVNFRDGNTSKNGIEYAFESSANGFVGDYLFSEDGKNLLYVAQQSSGTLSAQKTLMKLELESGNITTVSLTSAGGTSATNQARLIMDNQGRVWVSDPSTNAGASSKNYNVKLLNTDDMTLDAGGTGATNQWSGGVSLASSFSNFSVNGDSMYYIERSGAGPLRLVKQSLFDQTEKQVLMNDLSGATYNLDAGETYAISEDGQYIAYEDEDNATAGMLVVVNTETGEKASLQVGTRSNSITALDFDSNNKLYWTDTGSTSDDNSIKSADIVFGDTPEIANVTTLRTGTAGRFGAYNSSNAARGLGLSVGGGDPSGSYEFQVGTDSGMSVDFTSADVRLVKLGISRLDVLDQESAADAIAALSSAVDQVANTRAVIGSQVSRLGFTHAANASYGNNIAASESVIRDVDIAQESSRMTQAQILSQTSLSILAQANSSQQNVLRLLQ
jgi:flagellin